MADSAFVWVTHHVSVTRWLKTEVARTAPGLRFAFSRPGLTTFKAEGNLASPQIQIPSSFARAWGLSLGMVTTTAEVLALATARLRKPVRLHVFERDVPVPVDEQDQALRGTRAVGIEAALRAAAPDAFLSEARAQTGDLVLDVVVPHASKPDEPWLVGLHQHNESHGPWPGGVTHVPPPEASPSRAWCKIEEALRWSGFEPKPGETAIEIGAAPGGATYALLCRGLNVYGIDPGEMHPLVLGWKGPHRNRFVHLHAPAAEVAKKDLPERFQWLLLDVNLAPMIALRYVERFVALSHGGLKGAVLTLKVNDDDVFAALPRLIERIGKLAPKSIRVTQLPSHRSEVAAIVAW